MINTKLQTPIIACSLLPAPPPVLAQNITISFTLRKVKVYVSYADELLKKMFLL